MALKDLFKPSEQGSKFGNLVRKVSNLAANKFLTPGIASKIGTGTLLRLRNGKTKIVDNPEEAEQYADMIEEVVLDAAAKSKTDRNIGTWFKKNWKIAAIVSGVGIIVLIIVMVVKRGKKSASKGWRK